jgi:hypothetical protein
MRKLILETLNIVKHTNSKEQKLNNLKECSGASGPGNVQNQMRQTVKIMNDNRG